MVELKAEVVHLEVTYGDHRGRAVRVPEAAESGFDWIAPSYGAEIKVSVLVDGLTEETIDGLITMVAEKLKAIVRAPIGSIDPYHPEA